MRRGSWVVRSVLAGVVMVAMLGGTSVAGTRQAGVEGAVSGSGGGHPTLLQGDGTAAPSADDPVATVNAALDLFAGKAFAQIADLACESGRAAVAARYDLGAMLTAGLPEGVDGQPLLDALGLEIVDRVVELVDNDGQVAHVSVAGSLVRSIDQVAVRPFVAALLASMGQDATDAAIDAVLPQIAAQMEGASDLGDTLTLVLEDGAWRICEDVDAEQPSAGPASAAPASFAPGPMDEARYAELLALIPGELAASCRPNPYWEATQEPGELAAAQCDPDGIDGPAFAAYSLFDSAASMDAAYDRVATEYRDVGSLDGPGCGQGAGEGTWEAGRRLCYTYAGQSVTIYWTHDGFNVLASASRPDLDWTALESFWVTAGPIGPS